jgi:hypothetical protein
MHLIYCRLHPSPYINTNIRVHASAQDPIT